jgi:hypothetical protein
MVLLSQGSDSKRPSFYLYQQSRSGKRPGMTGSVGQSEGAPAFQLRPRDVRDASPLQRDVSTAETVVSAIKIASHLNIAT